MIDVSTGVPGVNADDPQTFPEFWAYYLSQHLHPRTRQVHAGATVTAIVTGVSALFRRKWKLLAISPLLAYGPAFSSHWIWEKNSPVVLSKGKPVWAAMADLTLVAKVLTGRIEKDAKAVRQGLGFAPEAVTIADQTRILQAA